jgi:hypothetical protein
MWESTEIKEIDNIIFDGEGLNNISINENVINTPYTNQAEWTTITNPSLIISDEQGEIEITAQEIRRIKEILQEKYPEDYI